MVDEKSIDVEAPDTEPAEDVVETKTEMAENAVETPTAQESDTSGDNVEVKAEKPKAKTTPA